ncbi:hypothetical protein ACA910_018832 [Epithemia clementina (nom. ined.)]
MTPPNSPPPSPAAPRCSPSSAGSSRYSSKGKVKPPPLSSAALTLSPLPMTKTNSSYTFSAPVPILSEPLLARQDSAKAAAKRSAIPLFDFQVMMCLEPSVAQGYITLLCGGDDPSTQQKRLKENRIRRSAIPAGFLAITEGNVLDACFGISQQQPQPQPQKQPQEPPQESHKSNNNSKNTNDPHFPAMRRTSSSASMTAASATATTARTMIHVKKLKVLLANAAYDAYDEEDEQALCKLAVMTYMKAFEIVLRTTAAVEKLTVWTKCFFYRGIMKKANVNLHRTFRKLQEVLIHYYRNNQQQQRNQQLQQSQALLLQASLQGQLLQNSWQESDLQSPQQPQRQNQRHHRHETSSPSQLLQMSPSESSSLHLSSPLPSSKSPYHVSKHIPPPPLCEQPPSNTTTTTTTTTSKPRPQPEQSPIDTTTPLQPTTTTKVSLPSPLPGDNFFAAI